MTQHRIFSFIFVTIFVGLLMWLGFIFKPFLKTIAWAVILARLAYPLYAVVLRQLNDRGMLAAFIVTVALTFMAILPAIYIVVLGAQESLEAYNDLSGWIAAGGLKSAGESLSQVPIVGRVAQHLLGRFIVSQGNLELSMVEASKWASTFLTAEAGDIVKNAVVTATDFLVMLLTLFFLFRDGGLFYAQLYDAIPLESQHKARIVAHLNRTVTAVIRGTVLTALAQGIVAGVTYAVLGVPFPVFLGALSALLAFLPIGGTALVWGPLILWFIVTGAYVKAVVLLLVGSALIGLMDNVLYYWLTGSHARLPMLLLFFASVGGIAFFGFIGVFLGPLLLAVVIAMFQIYREEFPEPTLITADMRFKENCTDQ